MTYNCLCLLEKTPHPPQKKEEKKSNKSQQDTAPHLSIFSQDYICKIRKMHQLHTSLLIIKKTESIVNRFSMTILLIS